MRFKYPGGHLAWLTLLWLVVGSLVAYHCYASGRDWLGGLFTCLAISCGLVWFDVRFIYKPLAAFWLLAMACGVLMMMLEGFTLRRAWQILLAGYTIYALREWGTEYERTAAQPWSTDPECDPEEEVEMA
jgi:hypothetical protein